MIKKLIVVGVIGGLGFGKISVMKVICDYFSGYLILMIV